MKQELKSQNKFEAGVSSISSELGEISTLIDGISAKISEPNNDNLIERLDGLEENIMSRQNENKISLLDKIDDKASVIKTELSEIVELIEKSQRGFDFKTNLSEILSSQDENLKEEFSSLETSVVEENFFKVGRF